jgi:hypothetical protein
MVYKCSYSKLYILLVPNVILGGFKIIRDGLTMKRKRLKKGAKSFEKLEYQENLLNSVINSIQLATIANKLSYFVYLKDPYALLLALTPMGVVKEVKGEQEYSVVTAKEYVEAILSDSIDDLWPRMTAEEQDWCNFWANKRQEFNPLAIVAECAQEWKLDVSNVLKTWIFQPDAVSIAFAVTSKRALVEHVTPTIGIPYVMIYPTDEVGKLRYPLCIDKAMAGYIHVQIHKDGDLFRVFDADSVLHEYADGVEADDFELDEKVIERLKNIPHTYVVEGWYKNGELIIWDILCWNDIWLHERHLSERLQLLWHFHEFRGESLIVYNRDEIPTSSMYVGRNLNAPYDPATRDSHIFIGEPTIVLQIGGRRGGGKKTFLNTSDGRSIFTLPDYVEKEDRGDVVEVTCTGKVLRVLPKNTLPDTWMDVCIHLGLNPDYKTWSYENVLKTVEWVE